MYKVFDLLNGSRVTSAYVDEALSKGVAAIHITVNNFSTINPLPTLQSALSELAAVRRHYADLHDRVIVIERFADFERATSQNKLGIVIGYQNVPGVAQDLKLLELFRDLGVRVIQIAHNVRGLYADGCAEPADAGLSTLGQELVQELNHLGIVIDLSHVGNRSGQEAVALSKHPIASTHANAFAVCPNVRNKSDGLLDALKAKDGVIGVCYLPPIVKMGSGKSGHADVAAHIAHICKRIGSAHVGIGSDFITGQPPERYQEFMKRPDVYGTWPWRFPVEDLADQQRFLESLSSIGLSQAEVRGIAHDNFMRLFRKVLN
ncbi:MAG: hypothetical protein EPO20_27520 [Betaproteobacteria bacterium]|nr:MAG: hypothetical protein EPO20_27520 [Betaproteobacteria bacterium]